MSSDPNRDLLRHTLATIAYRGGKAVRGAPDGFSGFRPTDGARSAGDVLAHIGDLLDWGLSIAKGRQRWHNSAPRAWDLDVSRFFEALGAFDAHLASEAALNASPTQLFQGPIADILTHIGQIALMRRLAASPLVAENYFVADIAAGRVGPDQAAPRMEFA